MLTLAVPGDKTYSFSHIVFDFNGTIAFDGIVLPAFLSAIPWLSLHLEVHVITADTFGSVHQQLSGLPCTIHIIQSTGQTEAKQRYLRHLHPAQVIAVGNGYNDALMLQEAELGFALCGMEGLAAITAQNADIIVPSLEALTGLLQHPRRLIATLRR